MITCVQDITPRRSWAYREPPESPEVLARRRQAESLLLERLFGTAGWASFTPCQRRLVDVLMGAVVPSRRGCAAGYGRGVQLVIGNAPGQDQAPIPFWINGGRLPTPGGHGLVRPTRCSFMVRAGYVRADAPEQEFVAKVPQFFGDLRNVAHALGVVVMARGSQDRDVMALEKMISMARFPSLYYNLCWLAVKVCPGREYLLAWQRYFAAGNHNSPKGGGAVRFQALGETCAKNLLDRMAALGLTLVDLAIVLGVTPTYICQLRRSSGRVWSPKLLRSATFINAVEGAVVGTLDGPWQPLEAPPQYSRSRGATPARPSTRRMFSTKRGMRRRASIQRIARTEGISDGR